MSEINEIVGNKNSSLIDFIKNILTRLEKASKYGATLLDNLSDEDRNRIYNIFEDSTEFEVVTLDDGTDIRLVIKTKSMPLSRKDIGPKLESAMKDIKLNRYASAISKYIEVLSCVTRGTADTYANMGELYAICGENEAAIEFLSVAMMMDKKHKHYEDLVDKLKPKDKQI